MWPYLVICSVCSCVGRESGAEGVDLFLGEHGACGGVIELLRLSGDGVYRMWELEELAS